MDRREGDRGISKRNEKENLEKRKRRAKKRKREKL